jgi:hypothetical protein
LLHARTGKPRPTGRGAAVNGDFYSGNAGPTIADRSNPIDNQALRMIGSREELKPANAVFAGTDAS